MQLLIIFCIVYSHSDDLEALLYTLLFLKHHDLPWGIHTRRPKPALIQAKLSSASPEVLSSSLRKKHFGRINQCVFIAEFRDAIGYIMSLGGDRAKIDYTKIRELILN